MNALPTRRQLREAERSGHPVTQILPTPKPVDEAPVQHLEKAPLADQNTQNFISRKDRREAEKNGRALPDAQLTPPVLKNSSPSPSQEPPAESMEVVEESMSETVARIESRQEALSAELSDVQIPDLDMPSAEFNGTNLFSEPSTHSIVWDVAPEAISLSIETGEIIVTGSISVLTDTASNMITDSMDGIELDNADRHDAVTGFISIVEPISALELIHSRVNVGVVPKTVLRKGWWRKWALGIIALGMVIAAIIATITIMKFV